VVLPERIATFTQFQFDLYKDKRNRRAFGVLVLVQKVNPTKRRPHWRIGKPFIFFILGENQKKSCPEIMQAIIMRRV
jgi:hypothetical protein